MRWLEKALRYTVFVAEADPIDWLSTQEAADLLGISTRTLYRLVDGGDLPAYKFGRVIRLQRGEVAEFIQRSRVVPGELGHLYPGGAEQA